jgi:hypothetical protein
VGSLLDDVPVLQHDDVVHTRRSMQGTAGPPNSAT